ncbi:MAG: glutathione peroxidase [Planctomycetota bacterium]
MSMLMSLVLVLSGLLAAAPLASQGAADEPSSKYVLDHEMERIEGETESLEDYKGKVLLMVNVASKCGYTPQYEGLQALYEEHKDDGLVIMGFPANNFGRQEPGSNSEILEFCESRFSVTFPMFAKISVKGDDAHPLYQKLAEASDGAPRWNFTKYLVNRKGEVIAKFESGVRPDSDKLKKAIADALAAEG